MFISSNKFMQALFIIYLVYERILKHKKDKDTIKFAMMKMQ